MPGGIDPDRPAQEVLPGSLKRKFPAEHLGRSLNQIREMLRSARGAAKRQLQTAKKLLEQIPRLTGD